MGNYLSRGPSTQVRLRELLLKDGVLRAGLNLSNFLLVEPGSHYAGVSPSMAEFVAARLNAKVEYVAYPNPGALTADTTNFGIGLVANEPQRAEFMLFSPPYSQIEATFLVREDMESYDRPGVTIAVSEGAAYDLYLSRTLEHATLKRAKGLDASFDLFDKDPSITALAGLRPKLLEYQDRYSLVPGYFTSIHQSIGVPRCLLTNEDIPLVTAFLHDTVQEALLSGLVDRLISDFNVKDRLAPAPPPK